MKNQPLIDFDNDPSQALGMCFQLLGFLNDEPGSTASGSWSRMKEIIASRVCPYRHRCEIYERTARKHPGTQLKLL